MKKLSILMCIITFLAGLALGLCILNFYAPDTLDAMTQTILPPTEQGDLTENKQNNVVLPSSSLQPRPTPVTSDVLTLSPQILNAIKSQDYAGLAEYVHPEQGVIFVPYSTVEPEINQRFSPQRLAGAASDTTKYIWGVQDGSGFPLELTIADYFDQFVFDADYTNAPQISFNQIAQSGNSLENVDEVFPDCPYVEFHYPGIDPELEGMDWCSLKLVFADYQGQWKLVALIHSQWTI